MDNSNGKDNMQRVSSGGLFHYHKVKYSPETEKLIKDLIRESKLSIFQRKKVEESVKNGDPLPLPPSKTARGNLQKKASGLEEKRVKYYIPRRRKKDVIQQTGAYEREVFLPTYNKANRDVEKVKLQEIMAFGRTLKSGKYRKQPISLQFNDHSIENSPRKTALEEIAEDIEDRKQFLARMESLGQGKQYRDMICQEIQEKLRLADEIFEKTDRLVKLKQGED